MEEQLPVVTVRLMDGNYLVTHLSCQILVDGVFLIVGNASIAGLRSQTWSPLQTPLVLMASRTSSLPGITSSLMVVVSGFYAPLIP